MLTLVTPTRTRVLDSELLTILNSILCSDAAQIDLAEEAKGFAQMLLDGMSAQDYMLHPELHEAFVKFDIHKGMK